jgi:hypothetical protein
VTGLVFDLLARTLTGDIVSGIVIALWLTMTVLGLLLNRSQSRRARDESEHAQQMFQRAKLDPAEQTIRLAVRPGNGDRRPGFSEPDGASAIKKTTLQEAEIYLQHHRIALKHYAAFQQAALWSGLLGFTVVLVGAPLTYFAGLEVGAVTALAGAIPAAAGALLFRQAGVVGDRAAENLRGLQDSVLRYRELQGALAATAELADDASRNRMYELIGMRMLFPNDELGAFMQQRPKSEDDDGLEDGRARTEHA